MAPVDIIIPVFEAAEALGCCIDSVLRHTDFDRHGLILVVDGPQSAAIEEILSDQRLSDLSATIVRNEVRSGFVVSANRGMALSKRDIVLLNSDTEVTARWIEKLGQAAHSRPEIATVTPFSNNATICSLPETLVENLLPAGFDCDRFGDEVEKSSQRTYPGIPTGVGVCLYVKRTVLDEIGLFDEEAFGLGYGEETDFCLRASALGFIHVLDDATFVFHRGQQSFSQSTKVRSERAFRKVRKRHPRYYRELAQFIKDDPLAPVRSRVVDKLVKRSTNGPRRRILHLVHGWPPFAHGGTEVYASWLAGHQQESSDVAVFARISDPHRASGAESAWIDRSIRCRFVVNNFDQRNPLARNAIKNRELERAFARFIEDFDPHLIHIHHLSGSSAAMMATAGAYGVPVVYQVQDWWAMCSRANLVNKDQQLCEGPNPLGCGRCLPLTSLPPSQLLNPLLYAIRSRVLKRQLAYANAYIMGSDAIRLWYEKTRIFAPGVGVHVLPYGVPDADPAIEKQPASRPLRFGFVGSLMPHKGAHIALDACRTFNDEEAELLIWGDATAHPEYYQQLLHRAKGAPVRLMSSFAENEKAKILASLDVLIVPSIGLESFGIVAREAMQLGTPVIASRLGALKELDIDPVAGALFEAGSATELGEILRRLVDDPQTIDRWRSRLPAVTTTKDHAREIDKIYDGLIES